MISPLRGLSAIVHVTLIAVLATCAPVALAQVFKCTEKSGKVVYSESPCAAASKSVTIQRSVPPVPAAAAGESVKGDAGKAAKGGPRTPAELEQEFRKRRAEQEKAATKEQEVLAKAKQNEDNCRRARAQMAGLEAGRQARFNEKGERYFLEDTQIEQEKAHARRDIEQLCK